MLHRLSVSVVGSRRSRFEAADNALWSMRGLHSGPHHLCKQIDIIISFTRHLLANRVQDFQKPWTTVHVLLNKSYRTYWTYITLSVASDTKNSGVTIIGT
jgi:hypothetical protein